MPIIGPPRPRDCRAKVAGSGLAWAWMPALGQMRRNGGASSTAEQGPPKCRSTSGIEQERNRCSDNQPLNLAGAPAATSFENQGADIDELDQPDGHQEQ